jgi:CRISPR-associated protein Cas2
MSKTKDYIISYDIRDPKRLSRLSRRLEKSAMRIQKSVYLYASVTRKDLLDTIDMINAVIDSEADDVRIYRMLDPGISLAQAVDLGDPRTF